MIQGYKDIRIQGYRNELIERLKEWTKEKIKLTLQTVRIGEDWVST